MSRIESLGGIRDFADYVPFVGVYFLFFKGELVYIGQSIDIASRLRNHRSRVGVRFDRALWLEVARTDLLAYEAALVRALNPSQVWRVSPDRSRDGDILRLLGIPADDSMAFEVRIAARGAEHGQRAREDNARRKGVIA